MFSQNASSNFEALKLKGQFKTLPVSRTHQPQMDRLSFLKLSEQNIGCHLTESEAGNFSFLKRWTVDVVVRSLGL